MSGSVRIKTCDLVLPGLHSQASATTSTTNTPANSLATAHRSTAGTHETDSGRAVDNQYSFV